MKYCQKNCNVILMSAYMECGLTKKKVLGSSTKEKLI